MMSEEKSKFTDHMIELREDLLPFCDLRASDDNLEKLRNFVNTYIRGDAHEFNGGPIRAHWVKCDRDNNFDPTSNRITFAVTATLTNDEEPQAVEFVLWSDKVSTDWCARCEEHSGNDLIAAYDRAMGCI